MHQLLEKLIIRITLYAIVGFTSCFGLASNNQLAISETSASNMTQGVVSYFYDITDGLLLLRGMFGLDGAALIAGTLASDAVYTDSEDIESRIEILGDLADVDGNGQIDALTDGLLTLRYLFGLEGNTLIDGVVAADATRTTAEEIEAHLEALTPLL